MNPDLADFLATVLVIVAIFGGAGVLWLCRKAIVIILWGIFEIVVWVASLFWNLIAGD